MLVTILGSSGKQTETRECVSLLVDCGDETIMVDTGPGTARALAQVHRHAHEVNNLILTHTHGDHILGYAYFLYTRAAEIKAGSPSNSLTVFGSADCLSFAESMFHNAYPGFTLPFDLQLHEVSGTATVETPGNTSMSFYAAIHAVPTLSTVFCHDGSKLVYTSDTLPNDALLAPAADCDLLIHEAMYTEQAHGKSRKSKHATGLDAGRFAANAGARQLALVHIASTLLGDESALLNEAASVYSGPLCVPHDGTVFYV